MLAWKPTGNPSNKTPVRLECWHRAGTRIFRPGAASGRAWLEGHVTRGGMLEAGVGGGRWRGEPPRLVKDLGTREVWWRGLRASSRGCSANPQLAGWGEVWGPLGWRGRPSLWSALSEVLRVRGVLPSLHVEVRSDWEVRINLISFQISAKERKITKDLLDIKTNYRDGYMWCENLILFRKALKEQFAKKMKIQSPSTQPHADGQSVEAPQENSVASLSQTAEVDEDLFQNVEKTKTKKKHNDSMQLVWDDPSFQKPWNPTLIWKYVIYTFVPPLQMGYMLTLLA